MIAQRANALQVAEEEKAAEEQRLADLEAAQEALAGPDRPVGLNGDRYRQLIWPIPGYSAGGGVGWRVHPVYGYRSCHTGVDISRPARGPTSSRRGPAW